MQDQKRIAEKIEAVKRYMYGKSYAGDIKEPVAKWDEVVKLLDEFIEKCRQLSTFRDHLFELRQAFQKYTWECLAGGKDPGSFLPLHLDYLRPNADTELNLLDIAIAQGEGETPKSSRKAKTRKSKKVGR